jgi:hypothetical protein
MSDASKPVDRRAVLAGAGGVGALAAVASLLPGRPATPPVTQAQAAKPAPDADAGYRLTEHVKQYYRTTRI